MYQVCPICKGTGKAGHSWPAYIICEVCKGTKIISCLTGMPPKNENNGALNEKIGINNLSFK